MLPDLEGLEITAGELKNLTGVDTDNVLRPAFLKNLESPAIFAKFIATGIASVISNKIFSNSTQKISERKEAFFSNSSLRILIIAFVVYCVLSIVVSPILSIPILGGLLRLIVLLASVCGGAFGYWFWLNRKINGEGSLGHLLEDVDRYNQLIKAIDVNDQIEQAVKKETSITDRSKVIEALKINREDLVKTLKLERIMRENKDTINSNPEMFMTNLSSVRTLQVSDQGSEYGRLLNESLQVAVSIQEEMRKLQSSK